MQGEKSWSWARPKAGDGACGQDRARGMEASSSSGLGTGAPGTPGKGFRAESGEVQWSRKIPDTLSFICFVLFLGGGYKGREFRAIFMEAEVDKMAWGRKIGSNSNLPPQQSREIVSS